MERARVCAIDAGNTAVKVQLFVEDEAIAHLTVERTVLEHQPTEAERLAAEFASTHGTVQALAIGCARSGDREKLEPLLEKLSPAGRHLFVSIDELSFKVLYESGTPGADRLANAMALRILYPGEPSLAVDFGTATNIVVVNAEGDFVGGAILPGVGAQARQLEEATGGRLPKVDISRRIIPRAIGNSTINAIHSGVLLGHAGAVDRLVNDMRTELGVPELRQIATGGWAEAVLPHTHSNLIWDRNLTLYGLRCFLYDM